MQSTRPRSNAAQPVLDADTAAFIGGNGIAIAIAARDAANAPSLALGAGCRVSAHRSTVEVFVDQEQGADLVRDVRAGSPLAVVFSEPGTHRTIQIKAPHALVAPLARGDLAHVQRQVDALIARIAPLGYEPPGLRLYFGYTPAQLVRVTFAPTAAFVATPGPGAGSALIR
jgi:hypothetical protein